MCIRQFFDKNTPPRHFGKHEGSARMLEIDKPMRTALDYSPLTAVLEGSNESAGIPGH